METSWYYVQGSERVGPVDETEIKTLYDNSTLNEDSYVWKKGFQNWERLKEVGELAAVFENTQSEAAPIAPQQPVQEAAPANDISAIPVLESPTINFQNLSDDEQVFSIKIGYDRGGEESEYGPFSISQLRRAYEENRINDKTFTYAAGFESWMLLGDLPVFERISSVPSQVTEDDRRVDIRKPFVARLFFHDETEIYEGICRDVSIGGLQVLVSNFPAKIGDPVTMNVHPDNSDFCFTANGKIVRLLDGDQGFSLVFDSLSDEAKQSISSYIDIV